MMVTWIVLLLDSAIVLNVAVGTWAWFHDHASIELWLFHFLGAVVAAILSLRFDKE
jgi:hypothetical protein